MIELEGKYNRAKVFTDNVESTAMSQIIELCNQEFAEGNRIRIMPDTHAGAGCTIGTTMMLVNDKVVPSMVGVDIGCGMTVMRFEDVAIDFEQLDDIIRAKIPHGFSVRSKQHPFAAEFESDLNNLYCAKAVNIDRALKSLGTLGGGNHFIEFGADSQNRKYFIVHSGSRNLGKQVAEFYQERAYSELMDLGMQKQELVDRMTKEGNAKGIQDALKAIRKPKVSKQLAYLQGKSFLEYLDDMNFVQHYAAQNRVVMLTEITKALGIKPNMCFTTIHNYIDVDSMILRKGAISANKDEMVLIPMNMRDGSLLCTGKGNADWNFSAPHGAGRIMSRSQAKGAVSLDEYKLSMSGIWTTSVNEHTIDESPMAYKPMDEILSNIGDTVDVVEIIKPLYNFKSN